MKKFLIALALVLVCCSQAQAGGWGRRGGRSCNGGFWSNLAYSQRGYVRPSYLSSGRSGYYNYGYYRPSYWSGYGGGYYSNYNYSQPVVVIKPPKVRPNIPIVNWSEYRLEEMATNKFAFARGLDIKVNRIEIQIVSRDYHGDTGALKKVKFQVRWIIFKHPEDHDEEVQKHDSVKLKFDEYGRFEEFDD